ncbi:hypothetical protein EXU30_00565 [Shewanella maritima]|uniref:Tetratricopeptide repeat protein n=1 Tax=Shewanella maritima TaxID=2520507 RepID=A0A411PCS3_9GAMM|nr:tetratricopeptide repeat protein [Shewanella maritima]QBF81353.1 hypothetical protein EXU30_00565 [Shewanella maritima]
MKHKHASAMNPFTDIKYKPKVKPLAVLITTSLLFACSSSEHGEQDYSNQGRATLGQMAEQRQGDANLQANNQQALANARLSENQRRQKLAAIYSELLLTEPDPTTRSAVEYRLVQLDTESYEHDSLAALDQIDSDPNANAELILASDAKALNELVTDYESLLKRYPSRPENQQIQYQLAKAYELQGNQQKSLSEIESLLSRYPNSIYLAELNFRRGEIYYNQKQYAQAYDAYKQVIAAPNGDKYRLNSMYMSGWALFKQARLYQADNQFLAVFDAMIDLHESSPSALKANTTGTDSTDSQTAAKTADFSFETLNQQFQNIAIDTQRVLSISLSQQLQAESLVQLITDNQDAKHLSRYQHILFDNLAKFLLSKQLPTDAERAYEAYVDLAPNSVWAARYSLALLELYQTQGKFAAMRALKQNYVTRYGLDSEFWLNANDDIRTELIPQLLSFSEQEGRRRYAYAQSINANASADAKKTTPASEVSQATEQTFVSRVDAFANAADALKVYLELVEVSQSKPFAKANLYTNDLLQDKYLYADANFEARRYHVALATYQEIAYPVMTQASEEQRKLQRQAAYDATITVRKDIDLLKLSEFKQFRAVTSDTHLAQQRLRDQLDDQFISHYSDDKRALALAAVAAELAFKAEKPQRLMHYADFLLLKHGVITKQDSSVDERNKLIVANLAPLMTTTIASINTNKTGDAGTDAKFDFADQVAKQPTAQSIAQSTARSADLLSTSSSSQVDAQDMWQTRISYNPTYIGRIRKAQQLTAANSNNSNLSGAALKQVQLASQLYAHQQYQLGLYAQAESAYALALNFTQNEPSNNKEMRNLLASSIYQQGQETKSEQPLVAVEHFLRLGEQIPESDYRANAEFEAADILLSQQQWQQGADLLKVLALRYPNNPMSASIPAKLTQSYESLERWDLAAEQLLVIIASADEADVALKREAQYTAADYYLKAGDRDNALKHFRTYAHSYPQPFDIAQEVRFKMSEFYREDGETNKMHFWHRKILSAHKQEVHNGTSFTTRNKQLASSAAFELGQAHKQSFEWVKLTHPLPKSLKRKQKQMKLAIGYYQQVLDLALAERVPQATYQLAQMYRILAADVMDSQRPTDLDELALEEYEILLEELAYPFEEKAIEIHESNSQRAWQNVFNQWVEKSFSALAEMTPALYQKQELTHDVIETMY